MMMKDDQSERKFAALERERKKKEKRGTQLSRQLKRRRRRRPANLKPPLRKRRDLETVCAPSLSA